MLEIWKNLPRDILHIILKFDGKVIYFNGKYFDINKIKESDYRYNLLRPVILKKTKIEKISCKNKNYFYFKIEFNGISKTGLAYQFGFKENYFEISYFDFRYEINIILTNI